MKSCVYKYICTHVSLVCHKAVSFVTGKGGAFLVAFQLQTESFYDLMGGVNSLILVAWSLLYKRDIKSFDGGSASRKWTVTTLFALSRIWLLAFLCWRASARGGDGRFEELKKNFCQFLVTWMLQAIWVFSIALPMLLVNG